jgi:hypothetical protein
MLIFHHLPVLWQFVKKRSHFEQTVFKVQCTIKTQLFSFAFIK